MRRTEQRDDLDSDQHGETARFSKSGQIVNNAQRPQNNRMLICDRIGAKRSALLRPQLKI